MSFLQIRTPDETFEYRPAPNAVLQLRIIPDDVEKQLRKKAAGKPKWHRGRQADSFDAHLFIASCLDYAIVSWTGVRAGGADMPCTLENKLLLPEAVKLEINRQCLGKEVLAADDDDDNDEEAPDSKKS